MKFTEIGLSNTKDMMKSALIQGYALPAFNFNNMEQLQAIITAAKNTHSPVILQVSESAIKYMTPDILINMVAGAIKSANQPIALNLDHGRTFDICKMAIEMGVSNVMIDASDKSFDENVALSRQVAEYAHKYDVSVEAELGALSGIEEDLSSEESHFTNPTDAKLFIEKTNIDSLAVSVGTSHGAYKMKNPCASLRFDILQEIKKLLPDFPLVLHGASGIPENLVDEINQYGGNIKGTSGIPPEQIERAIKINICKVNIDSDGRLAFTAAVRKSISENPNDFDPRKYLTAARDKMIETYTNIIENITHSANQ